MPTLDEPRTVRVIFTNPAFSFHLNAEDALLGKIPLPDKGDPGPLQFRQTSFRLGQNAEPTVTRVPLARIAKGAKGSALLIRDERLGSDRVNVYALDPPQPKKSAQTGESNSDIMGYLTPEAAAELLGVVYLKFHVFFHPHTCTFIKTLNHLGVPGLLTLDSQEGDNDPKGDTIFDNVYDPAPIVHDDYPKEDVDFRPEGAYSLYNWELFFHAPLLIADRLSKDQRFDDARKWFHYIFDPTDGSPGDAPAKYWKFLPFHLNDENGRIEELLETLNHGTPSAKKKLEQQVEDWRDDPFSPHMIARGRMIAYQKTVVEKYIESLIAEADLLFVRDTIEAINEAVQLYVFAYNLLGRRPEPISPRLKPEDRTYAQLKLGLDAFSNAMVELENAFPFSTVEESISSGQDTGAENLGTATAFYFCIPPNEKFLSYWDTIEDRLFKIRHCMNIEGMVRELPLFEPPIEPGLLVKAAAARLDISSVLNDIYAPLTPYRFQALLQRAMELCAEVKSLGQALMSVLEKKDAEALSALRAGHETLILQATRDVKQDHIDEAQRQLEALKQARKVTEARQTFYEQRIGQPLNEQEKTQLTNLAQAHFEQGQAAGYETRAQIAAVIPSLITSALGMSSGTAIMLGGENFANALKFTAGQFANEAADSAYEATSAAIEAEHARRLEEWTLQATLATKELAQIDKQIAAAEIQVGISEKDLDTHDKQIENAKVVEEFLRNKYTTEELYGWMLSQVSAVYFQTYKLAYDTAKRAERAFRFERGLTDSSFVQFGYWDSLKKGLLAGEKLLLDLKRMEAAYMDQDRRDYEITKNVSLLLNDPINLVQLKETGVCEIELLEAFFDFDCPGHYMRRIKSLSLTVPCIRGPYSSVNCKLVLLKNSVRINSNTAGIEGNYARDEDGDDPRFVDNFAPIQAIITSSAQNDSGLFELNFRDERYLPFEGAGAISRLRLEMTEDADLRQFDYDTISDVILHIRYTAREGGETLKKPAVAALKAMLSDASKLPLVRLFSAKNEFPNEWHRFLNPADKPNQVLVNTYRRSNDGIFTNQNAWDH
jgi:Tc toxin complex TcA C-terminal TcB-binding domain